MSAGTFRATTGAGRQAAALTSGRLPIANFRLRLWWSVHPRLDDHRAADWVIKILVCNEMRRWAALVKIGVGS